jgi:hypothetical protein
MAQVQTYKLVTPRVGMTDTFPVNLPLGFVVNGVRVVLSGVNIVVTVDPDAPWADKVFAWVNDGGTVPYQFVFVGYAVVAGVPWSLFMAPDVVVGPVP